MLGCSSAVALQFSRGALPDKYIPPLGFLLQSCLHQTDVSIQRLDVMNLDIKLLSDDERFPVALKLSVK